MKFEDIVAMDDPHIDLARAALSIAIDEYPELDIEHYLETLDTIAASVLDLSSKLGATGTDAGPQVEARLEALGRCLFDEYGFEGNTENYYDPRNSYLNDVLDRRTGIPISLSVVYMEVGKRVGLDIAPISFPVHFLVRVIVDRMQVVVDPFNHGAVIERDALVSRLAPVLGDEELAHAYLPRALATSPRREVVARMLRNLKGIYINQRDFERALRVTDKIVRLDPTLAPEIRDRGHLYAQLDCHQAALEDFNQYLSLAPDAQDVAEVRQRAERSKRHVSRLN